MPRVYGKGKEKSPRRGRKRVKATTKKSSPTKARASPKKTPSKSPTKSRAKKLKLGEEEQKFSIDGICAAVFTPFTDKLEVNYDAVEKQVQNLVQQQVKYVFVCGTTGEGYKMTIDERKKLLERWVKESKDLITVIAHVGAEALDDVKDLTKHAVKLGVRAIGLTPSCFFKPSSPQALANWLLAVSEVAPTTPLYYYHIGIMTGVEFRMEKLLEAVDGVVPTFRGLKFTDFNLHSFSRCITYKDGKYDLIYGRDEQSLGAAVMGCTGYIGSTYNYMTKVYKRMHDALAKSDLKAALVEQQRSQQVVALLENSSRYGTAVNVGKAILQLTGVPIGPPRPPENPMPSQGLKLLKEDLEAIGFFEWSK